MKRRHLPARDQQKMVKEGLQLSLLFILRISIVVTDRDKKVNTDSMLTWRDDKGTSR